MAKCCAVGLCICMCKLSYVLVLNEYVCVRLSVHQWAHNKKFTQRTKQSTTTKKWTATIKTTTTTTTDFVVCYWLFSFPIALDFFLIFLVFLLLVLLFFCLCQMYVRSNSQEKYPLEFRFLKIQSTKKVLI